MGTLINEINYELDRIQLYNDIPTKEHIVRLFTRWIKLSETESSEIEARVSVDTCLEHDDEIQSLRETVANLEERIRQAKEIL